MEMCGGELTDQTLTVRQVLGFIEALHVCLQHKVWLMEGLNFSLKLSVVEEECSHSFTCCSWWLNTELFNYNTYCSSLFCPVRANEIPASWMESETVGRSPEEVKATMKPRNLLLSWSQTRSRAPHLHVLCFSGDTFSLHGAEHTSFNCGWFCTYLKQKFFWFCVKDVDIALCYTCVSVMADYLCWAEPKKWLRPCAPPHPFVKSSDGSGNTDASAHASNS